MQNEVTIHSLSRLKGIPLVFVRLGPPFMNIRVRIELSNKLMTNNELDKLKKTVGADYSGDQVRER